MIFKTILSTAVCIIIFFSGSLYSRKKLELIHGNAMILSAAINSATEINFLLTINKASQFDNIQRCIINDRIISAKRNIERCTANSTCNTEIENGLSEGYYSKEAFRSYKVFDTNSLDMKNCK